MSGQVVASKHEIELTVLRHGRTAWNADGRFQGQTDVPLDEVGRSQAAALAAYLAAERFDVAITSDLARAKETAEIVLGDRELALVADPQWREMGFGAWEGLTWSQIVERHPELAADRAASPRFYTPQDGESFDELCVRVRGALEALDETVENGSRVLVVTHAGVLHALLCVALGEGEASALGVRFAPATVTRLRLGPAGNRLVVLNESPAEDAIA